MNEINSNKQIKIGASISYAAIFLNIAAALLYTPWMVGKIGQSDYALYTLSTSLISIFMMDFGISASVSRFIAKFRAEKNEEQIQNFLGIVYKLFLVIAAFIFVVLLVVFFFLDNIYAGLTDDEVEKFKSLYIIVGGYSLFSFPFMPLNGILGANEKFVALKFCDMGTKLLTIGLIVVALFSGMGVVAVVSANAVAGLVMIAVKYIIIRSAKLPRANFRCKDSALLKSIFSFSVWVTIMSIAQRCMFNLAPTILGIVSNSTEIAIFSPANALESYFYTFAAAINGLFLPKISRYIAEGKRDEIMSLMIKVGKYQMIVMGLIFTGFCVLGREFMTLWMGEEYQRAYFGAILIFLPDLFTFSQQIANTLMTADGKVKLQAVGYVLMAVVTLAFSFWLSNAFGAIGAAASIAIGYLANFIYINIIYTTKLKLKMGDFYKNCYLRTIPVIILSICLGILATMFIPQSGWLLWGVKGIIIVIIYALFALFFALNTQERHFVCKRIFRKG